MARTLADEYHGHQCHNQPKPNMADSMVRQFWAEILSPVIDIEPDNWLTPYERYLREIRLGNATS